MAMKFRAHDTFFIRKGWLSKGMKHVSIREDVFIAKDENPMDILGIGTNMVKALRYWLQAVGLTEEVKRGRRIQRLTPLGQVIFEHDRYLEELGTLYLLQYRLASNHDEATAWYFFFNEFSMQEFTRENFVGALQNYALLNDANAKVAMRSLNDDFSCIINTYVPRMTANPQKISPENNIDCPLGELRLVHVLNGQKNTYRKNSPAVDTLNPWILLAVIVEQAKGEKEVSLNTLLTAPCNIGKVFNLDVITMLEALYKIERMGEIQINRTAGLDVIRILKKRDFQACVNAYYASIE